MSGDDNSVDLQRLDRTILLLLVLNGDLGLAIRAQPPQRAILADICQSFAELGGHGMSQWHAVLGLIAGIAKHDSLITGAHIHLILTNMHTAGNVRALLVDANQHLASLVAQTLAVNTAHVI